MNWNPRMEDLFDAVGPSALGSRLRRLSDRLTTDVAGLYRDEGHGFEPRWYPLYRLLEADGSIAVTDAAARLGVTHASVSQIARSMVAAGVAESSRDPDDERRRRLRLTRRGRQLGRRLRPLWDDVGTVVGALTAAGDGDLLSRLATVEAALQQQSVADRVRALRRRRRLAGVRIVDYAPAYAEAFARLNLVWLRAHFEVEEADRRILGDPQGAVLEGGGAILFALEGDVVVGTCALVWTEHGLELAKMAVDESRRGLGIGRRLLEAAMDRAAAMGADRLHLLTHTKLAAAVSLYRKLGFVPLPHIPPSPYARVDLAMAAVLPRLTPRS